MNIFKCSGHDQLWQGQLEVFDALKEHNMRRLKESGIKIITCSCAECYRTFAVDYDLPGTLGIKVEHITQTLQGRGLKFKAPEDVTVAYHDPCRLGRMMGEYEAPRDLIQLVDGAKMVELENKYRDIFTNSTKSVVQINLYSRDVFGIPDNKIGTGSGFMWDDEGNILTNYHVIQPAVTSNPMIVVRTIDNDEYMAKIVGLDSSADLAIIKISNQNIDSDQINLYPLDLHDSDLISPGDLTIAIGSPFDQEFTMTTGIVSAIGRSLDSTFTPYKIPSVIQTDAAINPGNSGGPLLNKDGKVIGINTQIKSSSRQNSGVGFAVPINLVKKVVKSLIEKNSHKYAYLGISAIDVNKFIRERNNIPNTVQGALIINIQNNGPAEEYGLLGDSGNNLNPLYDGDIITGIDETKIRSMNELVRYLALNKNPGDESILRIFRDGKEQVKQITFGFRPE